MTIQIHTENGKIKVYHCQYGTNLVTEYDYSDREQAKARTILLYNAYPKAQNRRIYFNA